MKRILLSLLFLLIFSSLSFSEDYSNNEDGTTNDNETGLMWVNETIGPFNWENALYYCENLDFAGYTDWRLPNIKELRSIVDYNKYNPAINSDYFPDTKILPYWSSTTYVYSPDLAWNINFDIGADYTDLKSNAYYVRAVRGGQ